MNNPVDNSLCVTRRHFLGKGTGLSLGSIALGGLLNNSLA
ncbi:MAG: hypothetical protein RL179_1859, partial [Planctomycetota bacterium]